jgi:hypothetical protein
MKPNSLEHLASTIAFDSKDWSLTKRDAFIYGIVIGWDEEAMKELAERHVLNEKMVELIEALRLDYRMRLTFH